MEHVVQFGINIDDEAIKQAIHNNVEKKVIDDLKEDIKREICGGRYSEWEYTNRMRDKVESSITDFLEQHKQEIIETASSKLSERLAKTKAAKDILGKVIDDIVNQ